MYLFVIYKVESWIAPVWDWIGHNICKGILKININSNWSYLNIEVTSAHILRKHHSKLACISDTRYSGLLTIIHAFAICACLRGPNIMSGCLIGREEVFRYDEWPREFSSLSLSLRVRAFIITFRFRARHAFCFSLVWLIRHAFNQHYSCDTLLLLFFFISSINLELVFESALCAELFQLKFQYLLLFRSEDNIRCFCNFVMWLRLRQTDKLIWFDFFFK